MANNKSAEKRTRQIIKRTARNRVIKNKVKTAVRRFDEAVKSNDMEQAQVKLSEAIRQIDKAITKGILHKNTAARKKSRLTRLFNDRKAG